MQNLKKIFFVILFLVTIFYGLSTANAAVPHLINYQGRLTDSSGKPVADGAYAITFRTYDAASGGNLLWQEQNAGVIVQKGLFNVLLGSITALNLPFDKPYYLEIKVGTEVMSPRQQITSAGYAIRAESAEKIIINNSDLSPGYLADKVDNATIGINSVNKLELKDGGISTSKIASKAITDDKLADYTKSFNTNGYLKLTGGFLMQWGECSNGSVTFPIPFPNACFQVVISPGSPYAGTSDVSAYSISKIGFTARVDGGENPARWIAIGY